MKKEIKYFSNDVEVLDLAKAIAVIADNKKSENTKILSMEGVSSLTDYMVVTTGSNERHLKAIADEIEILIKDKFGIFCRHIEKPQTANWIVLDYLDVIVHIFLPESREFYGLEKIWADAKNIEIQLSEKTESPE